MSAGSEPHAISRRNSEAKPTRSAHRAAMSQDDQYPERGYNTEDVAALKDTSPPKRSFVRRHWGKVMVAAIIGIPALGLTLWTVIALAYTYSTGDRTGYIQQF